MSNKPKKIPVEVEFTEGYQERFTKAILKIYYNKIRKDDEELKARIEAME